MKIIPKTAVPEAASFAFEEMSGYLDRMLSAEEGEYWISMRIDPEPDTEEDFFSVNMTEEECSIAGNRPRALLLGAYSCLQKLGCRFPAPGRSSETVPAVPRSSLHMKYEQRASLRHRGVCIEGACSRENLLDFIDWLPKAGFNSFFLQFKVPYGFLERWYRHELSSAVEPEPFSMEDAVRISAEAEQEIRKRDLLLHRGGHGWTAEVLGYQASGWNREAPLPENLQPLAAEINGKRGLFLGIPADTNLCLSSPEAADSFVRLVVDFARENPGADYLHIWLADEYNNVCECSECRKTTLADQYVALLNRIDSSLTAEGLDTKLVFLLYQELLWPPVHERLNSPDRFVLMFAPISRTFSESYQLECDAVQIPVYRRNRIRLPAGLQDNLAFLRAWQKLFSGDSFDYDYPLGRAHYGDFGYLHIARIICDDVRKLRSMGLNGYMSCQELRAGMPNTLPEYVMGHALMDTDADFDSMTEEYFRNCYGTGWKKAFDCLSALSEKEVCDYVNGIGPRRNEEAAQRLSDVLDICADWQERLSDRNPEDDPVQEGFWHRLHLHLEMVSFLARSLHSLASGHEENARREWCVFRDWVCGRELEIQPWLDVYRLLEVTEKYAGLGPPAIDAAAPSK